MISIYSHSDWADSGHSVSQSLLVSLGNEPVVSDVGDCEPAVIKTRLRVLLREIIVRGRLNAESLSFHRESLQTEPHH